jgi:tetratricopeptide (TPR) repeat protein/transcriptional regulator with XRE-family HTH domain
MPSEHPRVWSGAITIRVSGRRNQEVDRHYTGIPGHARGGWLAEWVASSGWDDCGDRVFGRLVLGYRQRAGLTQEELAEKTGLSVRAIRNLEAGRVRAPRPASVRMLADALRIDGPEREEFRRAAAGSTDPLPAAAHPAAHPAAGPAAHPAAGHAADPPRVVPAQLPADLPTFAGRVSHLHHLDALLPTGGDAPPPAVVITALAGTAGVGKTALAVHWAHQVRHLFPDGQLYLNLRGFGPGPVLDPGEAVRRFLDALDVPPHRVPADVEAQSALYRSVLAGKRVLVVLDNAADTDQVQPLLPSTAGCLALITSRNQLTGLVAAHSAHPVSLDTLTVEEARDLLARRLGTDRVAGEPDAVAQIVAGCARLPLALAIVAARAATHPHFPLAALAAELRDARVRLDVLAGGEAAIDVRTAFSWSYERLPAPAARLFRLLGLHPGPDVSAAAVASLAGLPAKQTGRLLAELTRAHLVSEVRPGRYALHDLLRAYADELARSHEPDAERLAAAHRLLDHYLYTARAADRHLSPHRDPITVAAPAAGVRPEPVADHQRALDWFAAEHAVVLTLVTSAAGTGFDAHAWQLAWTLATFLDRRGHWADLTASHATALSAAQRLADPTAQAIMHRYLGRGYVRLGRDEQAHHHYGLALDLFAQVRDRAGQAHTHLDLAWVFERARRYREALDHAEQALGHYRVVGDPGWQARGLNAAGWYHALLGDHHQALSRCGQALALLQEIGDRNGQAATLDSLGYAHHHLGDYPAAVSSLQQALLLRRELGDRFNEAETLGHLGDAHAAAGDAGTARHCLVEALEILVELGHPDADALRARLSGTGSPALIRTV